MDADIVEIIVAILLPPLGVFLATGASSSEDWAAFVHPDLPLLLEVGRRCSLRKMLPLMSTGIDDAGFSTTLLINILLTILGYVAHD